MSEENNRLKGHGLAPAHNEVDCEGTLLRSPK